MVILILRMYKVEKKDIAYNADLSVKSENQLYKISHNTPDWENFKKNIGHTFGYAEIVSASKQIKTIKEVEVLGKMTPTAHFEYKNIEVESGIKADVEAIFTAPKSELTPEQKEIAELKAMVRDLSNIHIAKKPTDKQEEEKEEKEKIKYEEATEQKEEGSSSELDVLRKKYAELYKKDPNPLMQIKGLTKAINAFKTVK